jgi:ATP-dependent protease HslVU (ClpYQ) peptidase subunit
MTCIIGLEQNGKIFLGGDSASAAGNIVRSTMTEKVFRKDPFIIGYTSSFRMGQILHYCIDFPLNTVYNEEYMVGKFIETLRAQFKNLGFSKIENNEEVGGTFLVGIEGKIWQIDSDFQVNRSKDGLFSVGCGSEFALGALKANEYLLPRERVLSALSISAYFCPWVKPPFIVLEEHEGLITKYRETI